jgi:hypothetical protein
MNVYRAMTGYDPIIGNTEDSLSDPGMKARIFLHDCNLGYYGFISDIGPDLQCDSDFSMKSFTSTSSYESERTSSTDFSVSASASGSGEYYGVSASASANYNRATNEEQQASASVFENYSGEIWQAKATCLTHTVSISDSVRPLFTQDFIAHLINLDAASRSNNILHKKTAVKNFVMEFGTHFSKTTKLGAQLVYERRLETQSENVSDKASRSSCIKDEASASISASYDGVVNSASAEAEASGSNNACANVSESSTFELSTSFESTRIVSRGSKPKSLTEWIDSDFNPVPIVRYLEKMTALFKDKWMEKSIFFGFESSLSGTQIESMFSQIIKTYCSLLLEGILDDDCNLIGTHLKISK